MYLSIDTSTEDLPEVLRVIGAAYGVELKEVVSAATAAPAPGLGGKAARRTRRSSQSKVSPAVVREWAMTNGIQVSTRGVLPAAVVEAYDAQH